MEITKEQLESYGNSVLKKLKENKLTDAYNDVAKLETMVATYNESDLSDRAEKPIYFAVSFDIFAHYSGTGYQQDVYSDVAKFVDTLSGGAIRIPTNLITLTPKSADSNAEKTRKAKLKEEAIKKIKAELNENPGVNAMICYNNQAQADSKKMRGVYQEVEKLLATELAGRKLYYMRLFHGQMSKHHFDTFPNTIAMGFDVLAYYKDWRNRDDVTFKVDFSYRFNAKKMITRQYDDGGLAGEARNLRINEYMRALKEEEELS